MTNSIILKGISKLIIGLGNAINHSIFAGLLSRFDGILTQAALNSMFFRLIAGKQGTVPVSASTSIICRFFNNIWDAIYMARPLLEKWVANSCAVNTLGNLISLLRARPLRIIGIFGFAFITPNIIFELITGTARFPQMGGKLLILIIFLLASTIKVDIKRLLNGSRFAKVARWIVRYED